MVRRQAPPPLRLVNAVPLQHGLQAIRTSPTGRPSPIRSSRHGVDMSSVSAMARRWSRRGLLPWKRRRTIYKRTRQAKGASALFTPATPITPPTGPLATARTLVKRRQLRNGSLSSASSSAVMTPASSRPTTPQPPPQTSTSQIYYNGVDSVLNIMGRFGRRKKKKLKTLTPQSSPGSSPGNTRPQTPVVLPWPATTAPLPRPSPPSTPTKPVSSTPKRQTTIARNKAMKKAQAAAVAGAAAAAAPPPRPASAPPPSVKPLPPPSSAKPPPPPTRVNSTAPGAKPLPQQSVSSPPASTTNKPPRLRKAKSAPVLRPTPVAHPFIGRSAPVLRSRGETVMPHRPYPVRSLFDPSQERVPKSWHYGPSRALVIGLSYKRTPDAARPLNGTTNDARKVCQMLLDMGYPEDEIGLMLDDDPRFKTPTTKDVMQAIKWLIDGATSNHRLFFYFAGHGGQIRDLDGDELDGRDEILRMTDGYIVDDWLNEEMLQPLPEGCNFTALLDCCHSGTALDLPHNYNALGTEILEKGTPSTPLDDEIFMSNSIMKRTHCSSLLYSACADLEVAWDAKFEDDFGVTNKGLFTEYFVRNVYNRMLDVNAALTYEDLLYYTSCDVVGWCHENRHRLPKKRKYQTPQMSSGKPLDINSPVCM